MKFLLSSNYDTFLELSKLNKYPIHNNIEEIWIQLKGLVGLIHFKLELHDCNDVSFASIKKTRHKNTPQNVKPSWDEKDNSWARNALFKHQYHNQRKDIWTICKTITDLTFTSFFYMTMFLWITKMEHATILFLQIKMYALLKSNKTEVLHNNWKYLGSLPVDKGYSLNMSFI